MRAPPRLQFRGKLLISFLLVLSPLPFLLVGSFRTRVGEQTQSFLLMQRSASQSVAISLETTFAGMTETAWTLASTRVVSGMDSRLLDSFLAGRARASPLLCGIAVFDASGENRGWGVPGTSATPRLSVSGSGVFQRVMATNNAVVGNVVTFERLGTTGVEVGVPIRDQRGRPRGILMLLVSAREMGRLYEEVRRQAGQALFAFDRTGVLVFDTARPDLTVQPERPQQSAPLDRALAGVPADYTDLADAVTHDRRIGSLTPVRRMGWVAGASISKAVALSSAVRDFRRNILGLLLVLGLSGVMAYALARRISKPITQLKEQAKQIGEGNLLARSHVTTQDELRELGEVFNQTAARLEKREQELAAALTHEKEARGAAERAIRVREDFLSIASHELRTPLTPLTIRIDMLEQLAEHGSLSSAPEPKLRALLAGSRQDLRRLVRLIDELLDVSRIEAGRLTLTLREHDFSELVHGMLAQLASLFPGQQIERRIEPGIHCITDATRVEQVLTNLLTNAVKYGKGNPITVTLTRSRHQGRDTLTLSVRDRGIGIAAEDLGRVFEKFERAVPQRSFGGLGLGLYIVRSLAVLLGGSVHAESELGKGSLFQVVLPEIPLAPGELSMETSTEDRA